MAPRTRSRFLRYTLAVSFGLCAQLSPAVARPQQSDAGEEHLTRARQMMRQRKYEDALKAFKKANEQSGKRCAECFFGMAQAYDAMGAFKNAMESCDATAQLAGEDHRLRARAYNLKAVVLLSVAQEKDGKHQAKKLGEALEALEQAAQADPTLAMVKFNRGLALLRLERDAEGITELRAYLEEEDRGPAAADARKYIENPRRAREAYAPEFSLTTMQGEYLSLEELRGKVLLVDFWGTWCPPCVESVPALRNLNKRMVKEKFVMIAVSSDGEEDVWRSFVAKEKMVWPQYLDRDRKIQRAFQVDSFPTYVVIDHEGVVRYRSSGSSWLKEAALEDAVKKSLKQLAEWESRGGEKAATAEPPRPEGKVTPRVDVAPSVAKPVEAAPQSTAGIELPAPVLKATGAEVQDAGGTQLVRIFFSVSNRDAYPAELFEEAPDLPPCGINEISSRTWVEVNDGEGRALGVFCALRGPGALARLWVIVRASEPLPERFYIVLRDRRMKKRYESIAVSVPSPPKSCP